ncbi:anthranilate synthase component I [Paludifilum halophilum]|uniref:Anthranilate synthase component 1 n=1 Tax=Paludifilum halophilum TaxID=1642702 RepID=A0A235BEB7_9BACL|nr:anthranilate synthase component I [Paludifilum halophilum]OYD09975.1 anthranilate synthase component I [Paludifilum halophilum]
MYYPPFDRVRELSRDYSTIPVLKTIFADTETPIRLYQRLGNRPYSFLLESAEGGERWGRYSFIGTDPFLTFQCQGGEIRIAEGTGEKAYSCDDPLEELEQLLQRYRSPGYTGYPPFLGGAVGYIGYESIGYFEPVSRHPGAEGTGARDMHLMFCDRLMIVDHLKQEITLVANFHVPDGAGEDELLRGYRQTIAAVDEWAETLRFRDPEFVAFPPAIDKRLEADFSRTVPEMTKDAYSAMVEKSKEHIRRGDIFQIVPSQRWKWPRAPRAFDVYRVLRVLNPSPYMYYLSLGDEEVVGASPELLVRVTEDRMETRPIAGTRPRGADPTEDESLAEQMLADEKERAEHVMLLDLGRNDLGRISRYGSVEVTDHMVIEKYSHVMHMVSHVTGRLAKGRKPLDAFRSCFPAGTVSGAPKVKAMQLIAEMEGTPRGIYAGAIGYFSFTGNLDSCITIRTVYFRNGTAYIQAGGGVVADSDPEAEYEESRNKAKGIIRALNLAESLFSITAER